MAHDDAIAWLSTAVAAVVVAAVAATAVFVAPTALELALAAVAGAVPLFAVLATLDAAPRRLGRFVAVFCGSLVGLTLVATALLGPAPVEAWLLGVAGVEFAVGVNPVMTVLVGGALALSYYAVFRWTDDDRGDGAHTPGQPSGPDRRSRSRQRSADGGNPQ